MGPACVSSQVKEVEDYVQRIVYEVTGQQIRDRNLHLLSDEAGILPVDFLYVFSRLEVFYGKGVYHILEQNDYTVLTIKGLASAIQNLKERNAEA